LLRQFLLVGLLAGSAMACKYLALVSVVVPSLAVTIWLATRQRGRARWSYLAAFLVGLFVSVGPWLIRNAVETGNPVYPLAYSLFGGRDWDAVLNARWTKGHSPSTYSPASLGNLAVDVVARSKWISPLLFAFAPLALAAVGWRRRAGWLWLYVGWLFLSCWLFTHRIDRFWVPLLPVVALLAGGGAEWFWNALKQAVRGPSPADSARRGHSSWRSRFDHLLQAAIVVPCLAIGLFNLEFIVGSRGLCGYNGYLRDLDEAELIAAQATSPEIVWLNYTLPRDPPAKVLSVGDAEMFYARFPVVYNTVFDRSIIEEWCAAPPGASAEAAGLRDPLEIRRRFADEGITHVYVNWFEILRYRSPGNYGFSDFVSPELFAGLEHLGILGPASSPPQAAIPIEQLNKSWREEAQTWGKPLVAHTSDGSMFTTFQVFPVLAASQQPFPQREETP
jgi:hypothetical protein